MSDLRYLTDHYDEKIKEVLEFDAPLNFVYITDQHNRMNEYITTWDETKRPDEFELAKNHIESIQYILDKVPNIQCVISGGDVGNDYHPDPDTIRFSHKEVADAMYSLSVPAYFCVGNHDDAVGAAFDRKRDTAKSAILPDEMHELFMKYNTTTDKNYYYVDFKEQGYRFVFLDCLDRPYYKNEDGQYELPWRIELSRKQTEWLETVALNTDKNIFVFCHTPLHTQGIIGTEGLPDCLIKPYDDLLNGPRAYYDVKSHNNVLALIYGHVHYDNLLYDDGILTVTTLCSLTQKWHNTCPDRKLGTITETAFDVFSVKGNQVKITRFGAGDDRIGVLKRKKEEA